MVTVIDIWHSCPESGCGVSSFTKEFIKTAEYAVEGDTMAQLLANEQEICQLRRLVKMKEEEIDSLAHLRSGRRNQLICFTLTKHIICHGLLFYPDLVEISPRRKFHFEEHYKNQDTFNILEGNLFGLVNSSALGSMDSQTL